jgi:hypothetical protein
MRGEHPQVHFMGGIELFSRSSRFTPLVIGLSRAVPLSPARSHLSGNPCVECGQLPRVQLAAKPGTCGSRSLYALGNGTNDFPVGLGVTLAVSIQRPIQISGRTTVELQIGVQEDKVECMWLSAPIYLVSSIYHPTSWLRYVYVTLNLNPSEQLGECIANSSWLFNMWGNCPSDKCIFKRMSS